MNDYLKLALFYGVLIIVIMVPEFSFGQPGLPSPEPEQTPIDGGLAILAAVGGTYAIKKLRDKRKE